MVRSNRAKVGLANLTRRKLRDLKPDEAISLRPGRAVLEVSEMSFGMCCDI